MIGLPYGLNLEATGYYQLTRADDEGEARVYEGTLTRGRVPSPLRIVVDTKGLFRIERRAAGGLHESERL